MNPIIIGITGTLGAGKNTIVDYLTKQGFNHYSVREFLIEEIKKRNMPVNRDSMVMVGNDLRAQNSPSYIVDQLYEQARPGQTDCIIESIRSVGEVEALKKKENFYLFAIDADPKLRYERISKRNSVTDQVSFEKFIANETREMRSHDPNQQNLSQCIAMADFKFDNSGTFEELEQQVEKVLKKIKTR